MKILKRVGLVLLGIILLIVVVGLFMPGKTVIEKSIVVNAPVENVFDQVNTLTNWKKWSPWYKMDTTANITYSGPASGNGASYSWESKSSDVGSGTLTLSDVKPNEHITENMVFKDRGEGQATMDFAKDGNGVKVIWKMEMDHGFNPLMRIMGALFIKGALGKQFEDGLRDMKKFAESAPVKTEGRSFKIQQIELQPGYAVVMSGKIKGDEFGSFFGKAFPASDAFIKSNNLNPTGAPFAIIYKYVPDGLSEVDAGIPIATNAKATGNLKVIELKGGQAVKADYYGPYEGTGAAHEAIDKWMKANGKIEAGAPWEVYVTDPKAEKDTMKWLTEVIYPVK
ncbi:MAG: SRPBCC family protein [Sphingobacteriales bacterium JAD_PAG50586_3]|nr:MAG: SRPBCC family protein [Sphingobacteriales bacterium JAD_PAG50586_3]